MEEKKDRKLDKVHFDKIKDVSKRTNDAIFDLGKIVNLIQNIQLDLNEAEGQKLQKLQLLQNLEKESADLVGELREHYGKGEINADTGVFSPTE